MAKKKVDLTKKFIPSKKILSVKDGRTNFATATQEFLIHAEIINRGTSELSDIRTKYTEDLKLTKQRFENLKNQHMISPKDVKKCEKIIRELTDKKKQVEKAVRDYMPETIQVDENLYLAYYWYQVKPEPETYKGEFLKLYKRAFMEWFDYFGMTMGKKDFKFFINEFGFIYSSKNSNNNGLTNTYTLRQFVELLYKIIIELMVKKGIIKDYEKIDWKTREEEKKIQEKQEIQEQLQCSQIGVKDFVVRRSILKCSHFEHELKDIVAIINILDKQNELKLVKVNAGYCSNCKIFFILENTYQNLKNQGTLICRVSDEKTYLKNSSNFLNEMTLAQQSVLMQYGYNVSQTEGLSANRRQMILAVLIDKEILTKNEIVNYLEFFVNMRQYNPKFEIAVAKWKEDIEFVENYRIGEYHQYEVNAIYRK